MNQRSPVDKDLQKPAFRWTSQKHRAAILVAENELTDAQIAQSVGVSRMSLHNWKKHPEFSAQVGDHVGQIQAGMMRLAIAKKHKRLATLNTLHEKLMTVIEERATDYAGMAAGTGTGTVVRQIKSVGVGRDAQIVEEYAVDNSTMRTLMAIEEQAAKELGQWVEKSQIEDLTRVVEIVGITSDAI